MMLSKLRYLSIIFWWWLWHCAADLVFIVSLISTFIFTFLRYWLES
jgi:hypothetical protein